MRQVEAIRHWTVVEASWNELPDAECTWFVDPPYDSRVGKRYIHADVDTVALGRWCRARSGQVIACENVGATWLPFEPLRVVKGQVKNGVQQWSAEAVWTSG